jgi:integrase
LSARTVLHIHRLLRKAVQQAVIWQFRPTNPADAVEAPRPEEKEMQPIDEDRAVLLIESAENTEMLGWGLCPKPPRFSAFAPGFLDRKASFARSSAIPAPDIPILTGLCTGLRRGELLAIRWTDLDLDNERLTINQSLSQTREGGWFFKSPKNKSSRRTITLPAALVAALREHRDRQQRNKDLFGPDYPKHDLVIPLPAGAPWPPDRFTDAYVAFARRVGAAGIRFHDLRHTHASELLSAGTPVKTVSKRLGHANATVTMNIYAHLLSGDDERAAKLVQKTLGKRLAKKGVKNPK